MQIMRFPTKALEDGIKDGSIRKDIDPSKAAFMIGNAFMGFAQRISARGEIMEKEQGQDPRELLRLLLQALMDFVKPGNDV